MGLWAPTASLSLIALLDVEDMQSHALEFLRHRTFHPFHSSHVIHVYFIPFEVYLVPTHSSLSILFKSISQREKTKQKLLPSQRKSNDWNPEHDQEGWNNENADSLFSYRLERVPVTNYPFRKGERIAGC